MLEWQEERIETYVEYCQECMMNAYNNWMAYASYQNNEYANNNNNVNYANGYYQSNSYKSYQNNANANNNNASRNLMDVTFEQFKDQDFMEQLVKDHAEDVGRRLANNNNNYNGDEEAQQANQEWMNSYQQQMWDDMKVTFYEACPEYDLCSEYQNVMTYLQEQEEEDDGDDLTKFFECTEVERNNGNVAYID